jgi:hypothetical protein
MLVPPEKSGHVVQMKSGTRLTAGTVKRIFWIVSSNDWINGWKEKRKSPSQAKKTSFFGITKVEIDAIFQLFNNKILVLEDNHWVFNIYLSLKPCF